MMQVETMIIAFVFSTTDSGNSNQWLTLTCARAFIEIISDHLHEVTKEEIPPYENENLEVKELPQGDTEQSTEQDLNQ